VAEPVEIRLAIPGDEDSISKAAPLFDHLPRTWETQVFLEHDDHFLWLAYQDRKPVGFLSSSIYRHPDKIDEMFIHEIGVAEPARRQGIGRELLDTAKRQALRCNCNNIWVLAELRDDPALAFYRSLGRPTETPSVMFTWSLS